MAGAGKIYSPVDVIARRRGAAAGVHAIITRGARGGTTLVALVARRLI